MSRWTRPYSEPLRIPYAIFYSLLSVVIALAAVSELFRDTGNGTGVAIVGALMIGIWWSSFRSGLFVGDEGVRIRSVFQTITIPWSNIAGFSSQRHLFGEHIVVVFWGGHTLGTALRRSDWTRRPRYNELLGRLNAILQERSRVSS